MKNYLLILIFLFSSTLIAGEKIDKKLDVPEQGELEIQNNRGKIRVTGWDKNIIRVKGRLDDLTEDFIFSTKNGKTTIDVRLQDTNIHAKSGSGSKLEISVPRDYSVKFDGISTELDFLDINNGVYINSVSGDIDIENVHKRSYINSVSGDIEMKDVSGKIEVSTVSGNITINAKSGAISVTAVSADIKVTTKKISQVKLSTISGDNRLYGSLEKSAEVILTNISGDSYFYVNGELNARVDLDTGPSGEVINRYSADKPTSSFIGAEKLKFTAGAGDGLVVMSTVSGEIGLRRPAKK